MNPEPLDQKTVLAKLKELRSRAKAAEHFGISRKKMTALLDEWGLEVPSFLGSNSTRVWNKNVDRSTVPTFQVGEVAMWCPVRPRAKCYGLPIATLPVQVKINKKRSATGHYYAEVVDSSLRKQLSKEGFHLIHEYALKTIKAEA